MMQCVSMDGCLLLADLQASRIAAVDGLFEFYYVDGESKLPVIMSLSDAEAKKVLASREGKRTLIGCVIDESGSMSDCVGDTIGGYNNYIKEQSEVPGIGLTSRILFSTDKDNQPTQLVPLSEAGKLDRTNYKPGGATPLWDSVGRMINYLSSLESSTDQVVLLVITDGQENASKEFTKEKIAKLQEQKEKTGRWTVVFMGASFDASHEAAAAGVGAGNVFNFAKHDTKGAYAAASAATHRMRSSYLSGGPAASADLGLEASKLLEDELAKAKTP